MYDQEREWLLRELRSRITKDEAEKVKKRLPALTKAYKEELKAIRKLHKIQQRLQAKSAEASKAWADAESKLEEAVSAIEHNIRQEEPCIWLRTDGTILVSEREVDKVKAQPIMTDLDVHIVAGRLTRDPELKSYFLRLLAKYDMTSKVEAP